MLYVPNKYFSTWYHGGITYHLELWIYMYLGWISDEYGENTNQMAKHSMVLMWLMVELKNIHLQCLHQLVLYGKYHLSVPDLENLAVASATKGTAKAGWHHSMPPNPDSKIKFSSNLYSSSQNNFWLSLFNFASQLDTDWISPCSWFS